MSAILQHRIEVLEDNLKDQEVRVRALEIAHARIIGWAAGGAFIGGVAWSALSWLVK